MKCYLNNLLNPLQNCKLKPKASQDGCGELGNIEPSFQVNIISHLMFFEISRGQDHILPPSRRVTCAGHQCLRAFVLPLLPTPSVTLKISESDLLHMLSKFLNINGNVLWLLYRKRSIKIAFSCLMSDIVLLRIPE